MSIKYTFSYNSNFGLLLTFWFGFSLFIFLFFIVLFLFCFTFIYSTFLFLSLVFIVIQTDCSETWGKIKEAVKTKILHIISFLICILLISFLQGCEISFKQEWMCHLWLFFWIENKLFCEELLWKLFKWYLVYIFTA